MTVTLERVGDAMIAVLDDGKANALTFEAIAGLRSAVHAAVDENAPLLVTGRTGYFSAGFDLGVMRGGDRDLISSLSGQGFVLFREMLSAPIPVIASCTGHALAAGALLLLAADYRIGLPGTYQIGLNETRIGIALPKVAVDLARFRLSPNRLAAATLFATVVTPELACEYGYLDRIDTNPLEAVRTLASEIASWDRAAFAKTKSRMNAEVVRQLGESPPGEVRRSPVR